MRCICQLPLLVLCMADFLSGGVVDDELHTLRVSTVSCCCVLSCLICLQAVSYITCFQRPGTVRRLQRTQPFDCWLQHHQGFEHQCQCQSDKFSHSVPFAASLIYVIALSKELYCPSCCVLLRLHVGEAGLWGLNTCKTELPNYLVCQIKW